MVAKSTIFCRWVIANMDVETFMKKKGIKRRSTVEGWLKKDYIPGSHQGSDGQWFIPENARCPYTDRGNCTPDGFGIYKSLVKAYSKGKNVVPALYGITPEKLNSCNRTLLDKGFIKEEHLDGLIYFNATLEGMNFISWKNSKVAKFLGPFLEIACTSFINVGLEKMM